MIGAIFWNYLSVVFGFIAETVAWERWEGTMEYTFMAPVRRWTQLVGLTSLFSVVYGLCTPPWYWCVIVLVLHLDIARRTSPRPALLNRGWRRFIGIGIMAAILPLLYVERGSQMMSRAAGGAAAGEGVYYSRHMPQPLRDAVLEQPRRLLMSGRRPCGADATATPSTSRCGARSPAC